MDARKHVMENPVVKLAVMNPSRVHKTQLTWCWSVKLRIVWVCRLRSFNSVRSKIAAFYLGNAISQESRDARMFSLSVTPPVRPVIKRA